MAKKGKEFEFAGIRFQIDPLILARRVVTRQIPLLAVIAIIGGALTAVSYVRAEKKYESRAKVIVRNDVFEGGSEHLEKVISVAGNFIGSNIEMIVIMNELDLFANMRKTRPYEVAIDQLRGELTIALDQNGIVVAHKSSNPQESQRIVAFATERVLARMAELNEAPFTSRLDAVEAQMRELKPQLNKAEGEMLEFKAQHPAIVASAESGALMDVLGQAGRSLMDEIRAAERELADARAGRVVSTPTVRNTANTAKLATKRTELTRAKQTYTANHPVVLRLEKEVNELEQIVRTEAAGLVPGVSPEQQRRAGIEAAERRLRDLRSRKEDEDRKLSGKPKLQRQWAELSRRAAQLQGEIRELNDKSAEIRRDKAQAANSFQQVFQLTEPALVPKIPVEPTKGKFLGIGIGATAVLGLLIALLREGLRQTFVNHKELEESSGMQVFAVLPNIADHDEA